MELVSSKDTDGCFMEIIFIETRFSQILFSEKLLDKAPFSGNTIKQAFVALFLMIAHGY